MAPFSERHCLFLAFYFSFFAATPELQSRDQKRLSISLNHSFFPLSLIINLLNKPINEMRSEIKAFGSCSTAAVLHFIQEGPVATTKCYTCSEVIKAHLIFISCSHWIHNTFMIKYQMFFL